ncbi:MAG: acylphosphatase [Kiritimatiellae bacterium]|nr:acylphosphatase [Kiritimatiellia bacterium]
MSEASPDLSRAVARYTGHVQGVGFRFTVLRISASHRVQGFVRNEPDGSVTVVAEGEPAEVGRFLEAIGGSPLARWIRNSTIRWEPPQGGHVGFTIGY